ncbi:MAG: Wzz/FepE/Etk N-terminal domain-containing protein [Nibricoccus sp.]
MLAYDEPVQAQPRIAPASDDTTGGFSVGDLARLFWQKRIAIAAAAMIGAVCAIAIGKSLTPRYTATSQLYVDPRELQLVDRELTPRNQDASGLPMIVESQARLITSNSVLFKVIENEKLESDPEFGASSSGGFLSSVGLGSNSPETRRNATLDALTRHITVRRTDRTFIVEIDVWSP